MPRRTKITVCVDSSIFLAEMFGNETQLARVGAIDRYQGIFRFKKCMPETVKKEVDHRMYEVTALIAQASKDFMKRFLSTKGEESTISLSDLPFIQSFFSNLKTSVSSKTSELGNYFAF